jgi:alkylation response protein AidB-like acyl-CoA dehydrogenase
MRADPDDLLPRAGWSSLAEAAEAADTDPAWPAASWEAACRAGIPAWGVPAEYGGTGLAAAAYLLANEALAGACLTTAFLLSQRDAAVRRLVRHASPGLLGGLLPDLAIGRRFATVGLSQLTTSRQHGPPAVRAEPVPDGYRVTGELPWVTGADAADAIVAGATLTDGRQVLFLLRSGTPGLSIGPPLPLCALAGSRTAAVRCDGVVVATADILAGPAENVMAGPAGGTGGLETSCLALGLAGAATDWLAAEAGRRSELGTVAEALGRERSAVRAGLHAAAENPEAGGGVIPLRVRATRLALSATQAALTAAKGAGFVRPHPAQRWARQALFFLVWSCPRPAAEGLLGGLTGACEEGGP